MFFIFNINDASLWISDELKLFLYAVTFTATFLLPLLSAFLLLQLKIISSLEMKTRQERKIPYLVAAVFYFAESYFLLKTDAPILIKALMFGATLLVASVLFINLFWKISAHMVGIGGLIGMLIAISYRLQISLHLISISLFLIAGLVGFSRLKLSAHNPAEVYIGFLLGIGVQLILFL
ncbi:MAG: hypothetical protein HY063_06765 [Bacteroidetes bacterium]|nr:hypothetical protein [Bacteroidota bacterium]